VSVEKAGKDYFFFFLKSPRFQASKNWLQAKGLMIFIGGA
jgi:hypothetical protein